MGWCQTGTQFQTPIFDGAKEGEINEWLVKADLPSHGKVSLYDGRTGERWNRKPRLAISTC